MRFSTIATVVENVSLGLCWTWWLCLYSKASQLRTVTWVLPFWGVCDPSDTSGRWSSLPSPTVSAWSCHGAISGKVCFALWGNFVPPRAAGPLGQVLQFLSFRFLTQPDLKAYIPWTYHYSTSWMGKDWWSLFSLGDRDPGSLAHVALAKEGNTGRNQDSTAATGIQCTGARDLSGPPKRAPSSLRHRCGTVTQGRDVELWKAAFPRLNTGPSPTSSLKGSRSRLRWQCRGSGVRKGGRLQILSITLCESVWSELELQRKLSSLRYPRPLRQLCFRELKELKVTDWLVNCPEVGI